jgi:hypothetical protein
MWLPQLLQRITISSRPFLLTFVSKTEYFSSEESSGEIVIPHLGHEKSPFPSILVKSRCTLACFVLFASCSGLTFSSAAKGYWFVFQDFAKINAKFSGSLNKCSIKCANLNAKTYFGKLCRKAEIQL